MIVNNIKDKYNKLSPKMVATFWFIVCAFIQKAVSVIYTPIFTRIMSTQEFGQFNIYQSWAEVLRILFTLQLAQGVYTQGIIKYDHIKDQFSSAIQGLNLTLVLVWFVIYLPFRGVWNTFIDLTTCQIVAMFLKVWSDGAFEIWAKGERAAYRYKQLVFIILVDAVVRPILGVIVVMHVQDKVTGRVWEMALVAFLLYSSLFAYQIKRGKVFFSWKIWKYALKFNIPLIPHYMSQVVLNSSDRIMIGKMVDSKSAGIYSLAYSVSLLLNLFIRSFSHAMSPWTFSQLKNGNYAKINRVGKLATIVLGILNLIFIAFAPEILRIFAPPQYHEAVWIIPPVSISLVFQFSYYLFTDIELYSENTRIIALATALGAIMNLFLNYVFIKRFGYYVAAYTTLFCYFLIALFHYIAMRKMSKESYHVAPIYDGKAMFGICAFFTVTAFFIMLSYNYLILRVILVAAIVAFSVWKKRDFIQTLKELGVYKS